MTLTQRTIEEAYSSGAVLVAVADVSDLAVVGYGSYPRAVSYAVRLSDEIFDRVAALKEPDHAYFHQYRTANALLDHIGFKVGLRLQEEGHRVLQIAASQSIQLNGSGFQGLFSHRAAALRAGHGWIGKSNSLVTPEFGPRVRFGTLLTHAPIEAEGQVMESQCGECKACVSSCPALALTGRIWDMGIAREAIVDVQACSDHMHSAYQHIGRGVVCGVCLAVCPYGNRA